MRPPVVAARTTARSRTRDATGPGLRDGRAGLRDGRAGLRDGSRGRKAVWPGRHRRHPGHTGFPLPLHPSGPPAPSYQHEPRTGDEQYTAEAEHAVGGDARIGQLTVRASGRGICHQYRWWRERIGGRATDDSVMHSPKPSVPSRPSGSLRRDQWPRTSGFAHAKVGLFVFSIIPPTRIPPGASNPNRPCSKVGAPRLNQLIGQVTKSLD